MATPVSGGIGVIPRRIRLSRVPRRSPMPTPDHTDHSRVRQRQLGMLAAESLGTQAQPLVGGGVVAPRPRRPARPMIEPKETSSRNRSGLTADEDVVEAPHLGREGAPEARLVERARAGAECSAPAPCRTAVTGPSSCSDPLHRRAHGRGVGHVGGDVEGRDAGGRHPLEVRRQLGVRFGPRAAEQGEPRAGRPGEVERALGARSPCRRR